MSLYLKSNLSKTISFIICSDNNRIVNITKSNQDRPSVKLLEDYLTDVPTRTARLSRRNKNNMEFTSGYLKYIMKLSYNGTKN